MSTPPGAWKASKMVTWWPDLTSSPAAVSPARPPPPMAPPRPPGAAPAFRRRRAQQVRVAEVDLLEVRRAHIRHPFGHGVAVDGHALTRLELRSLAHREASAGAPAARVFSMPGPRLARASCSKLRYVARRSASIPKSTLCPSNSGPSTHA